jgi:EAL domain-containing protein (putative c-di-GMP-specific phosphodiesterase class I)
MVTDPSVAPEEVIRDADAAMYRAKERGRSRFELFDEESRRRAIARIEFEGAIRQAVERGQLRVRYQPRVALNAVTGAPWLDAQVHWQHPRRGLLGPTEFMPLADGTGMAIPIGRFAVEHALDTFARWRASRPDIRLSLGLSSRQLRDPSLAPALREAVQAGQVEPAAICLEVPEVAVGEDPEAVTATLRALKGIGVGLALSGFGSGAASFSHLRRLPIDALKIHASLVMAVRRSEADASIVGALVRLGHALGLDVVADGVETEAQLDRLRELGCDHAQGGPIGPPMTGERVESVLVAEVT